MAALLQTTFLLPPVGTRLQTRGGWDMGEDLPFSFFISSVCLFHCFLSTILRIMHVRRGWALMNELYQYLGAQRQLLERNCGCP